jgi:glycosyltransferase involved in cell wall biosynthesis
MKAERVHIAVCIATHRRPAGLRNLLQSLDKLTFRGAPPAITLVICDNAPDAPAFASPQAAQSSSRWPVVYLDEPVQGIVMARNRCLANLPKGCSHVVFVDDDETVSPGWIDNLLATIEATRATAVQGPVEPQYAAPPPSWIDDLGIFRLGPFEEGQELNFAATNNSMVALARLPNVDFRFSAPFNDTGGEDEELFSRIRAAGGTIRAAAGALVTDAVPEGRLTARWVLRRYFRMGNTLGRITRLRGNGRALRVAKGVGAVTLGLLECLGPGLVSQRARMRGLMQAARGTGMLAAFVNFRLREYSAREVALDRAGSGG